MACDITNLGSCLVQAFFDFISGTLNTVVQPLLSLVQNLLKSPVNLSLFSSLWAIIVYILSMFYALLIMYSGFQFIISSESPQKRENAKNWLKNIIIMIVLIQASFFIYELVVQIGSFLTTGTLGLVANNFFQITADSTQNASLDLIFFVLYVITLILTSIILIIRYGIVAIGVFLFPLGIFFYFIHPLKSYGIMLLNFLGIAAFINFLDAVFLVGFSMLLNISLFAGIRILVMISAFGLIDLTMFFLMFFSIIKAGFSLGSKVTAIAEML